MGTRPVTRRFHPGDSRAVLIGAGKYRKLPSLPSVRTSLEELRSALTDPRLCGLPSKHCVTVADPTDGNRVGEALARAAADATDMLLVYYAGHGLTGMKRQQLFLGLRDTDPQRPQFNCLPYDVLREEVLGSRAKNRIVILDCCFSGRATTPLLSADASTVLDQMDIEGAYVLAASPANSPAVSGERITEFTHELLRILRQGVPAYAENLTLDTIYTHLRDVMRRRNLPEPKRLHTDAAGHLALAPNPMYPIMVARRREAQELERQAADDRPSPADAAMTGVVNQARRTQALLDRLLRHVDGLERDEEDPDRLDQLFRIDHLAVRMRRAQENLMVLADAEPVRRYRDPVPLYDVLRAAQSEIEQYDRVEVDDIDSAVAVIGHAVNDVTHLLAELLENATAFSPPHLLVRVRCRLLGDRALLAIEDSGLGMSADSIAEANEMLSGRVPVDTDSQRLGLAIVAKLARRLGIWVQLRSAEQENRFGGGIIADVSLPESLLVRRATARGTARVPYGSAPAATE
ncbi:MAG: hypothetical protein HOV71_21610 [Hamadaea sp.]|nr:hypothetical protein [Hamadaea sp.]NUR50734.1 hypothetical protein [Hamadaea sp.]NUT03750.1 hypothetical protein [Hamadaea sp.]